MTVAGFFRRYDEARAVHWLVDTLRTLVALAAAAQVGRCWCRRAIPWERTGWANPHCYECMPEDDHDRWRRKRLSLINGELP